MVMYDELVKKLRYCGNAVSCISCPYWAGCDGSKEDLIKAANAIEELRKAVLRLEDESDIYDELPMVYIYPTKWIPVTEWLPLYGQDVLAVRTYGDGEKCQEVLMAHISVWNEGTGKKWWNATNITHWMPLPEPPKVGE